MTLNITKVSILSNKGQLKQQLISILIALFSPAPHAKKIVVGILILLSIEQGFGQTLKLLTGQLKDEKGMAISYANIGIFTAPDSSLVTGDVTNEDGYFEIKAPATGQYVLKASAIGFIDHKIPFTIAVGDKKMDFGLLPMKENVQELNEVKINSMRPTIVNEVDKMVVSIEGTALAAGSSVFEILSKAPGVWVDQEGNVQLNGKAGVRIMIDGRPTYLSEKQLQNMLEGMSAENLKTLEIITNPSARYEAEGTAGIINITLKKNQSIGINGSVYGGYEYRSAHGYSGGGNINIKKGKWNSFANVDMSKRPWLRTSQMNRAFNEESFSTTFDQKGREEVIRYTPSVRLGTDFDINERNSIGVMMNLSYHDAHHDFKTASYLKNGPSENDLFIDAENYTAYQIKTGTLNFHYTGKLDTTGTVLSADLNYVKWSNNGNLDFYNRFYNLHDGAFISEEILTSDNPTYYDVYAAKVDFEKPIKTLGKFELGLKASYVQSDNKLDFYKVEEGNKMWDNSRSNHFIYREYIYAGYGNFSAKLNDTWSLQAGIRAEQTIAEGESVSLNTISRREYLDLFPSIFVQQKISEHYQISYNYSRRIDRPQYESLNPFIFYLDPYTWAQGNPLLRPQYTHSLEMKHTWKNNNLILSYSKTKDLIAEVPQQNNENKTTVFSPRNVDDYKNLSTTLVVPVQIIKSWSTTNNITLAYQQYNTLFNAHTVENKNVFFMAQSTHNFQLPKKVKMEINAAYVGPSTYGLYKFEPHWWIDAGLKRSFMKEKLDVSFNVSDIFRTRQLIGSANMEGNINSFDQYFSAQSFKISIRYIFNKGEKFEMKNRDSNLDELNRIGG